MLIEFEVMYRDEVLSKVRIKGGEIETEHVKDYSLFRPFPKNPTMKEMNEFLEERCIPRTRANIKELLRGIGLSYYEPLEIVKHTHGVMFEDFIWIKFKGEELSFDDIKMRD